MPPTQKESSTAVAPAPTAESQTAVLEYTDNHQPDFVAEMKKSVPEAQSPAHMEDQQKNLKQLEELRKLLGGSPDTYDNIGEAGANKMEDRASDIPREPFTTQIVDFVTGFFEEFNYDTLKRRAVPRFKNSKDFYKLEMEKATLLHQVPEGESEAHKPPPPPPPAPESPTVAAPVPPAFEQAFKDEPPEATDPTRPEVPPAFTQAFNEPASQPKPEEQPQAEAVPAQQTQQPAA